MPGTYSQILLHVVFSTKHREQWIKSEVATIRRPVGAKDGDAMLMENAEVQRPALPSSIFIAAASARALRRMLVPYRRASWRTSRAPCSVQSPRTHGLRRGLPSVAPSGADVNGTGRSCRLFLRPLVTRCAGSCY